MKTFARMAAVCAVSLAMASEAATGRWAQGLVVRLDPAFFVWGLDGAHIASQVGGDGPNVGPALVQRTPNAFGAIIHLGYNILGHASLGVDFTATGWGLSSASIGGAGFIAGTAAWHPAALFESLELLPNGLGRHWDASLFLGLGHGVVGQDRALDGLHWELGMRGEYFLSRFVSVGAALRFYPLLFSRYVIDWSGGADVALQKGSGGSVFIPTLTLAFHAPLTE